MLNKKLIKNHPLMKMINSSLIDLPTPSSISFMWNFGSLMGIIMLLQLVTGVLLSFHYTPHTLLAFQSLIMMIHNYPYMWLINWLHSNGASMFFILIYLHIGRNIYFCTFKNHETWSSGVMLFFLLMMTAFLGYILPWGQMSFWGTTVITNLLSPIPYIGPNLVTWLWGGFSIDCPTLKRFFSLHFLIPLLMSALILIHLIFLHQTGSSNPSGLPNNFDKTQFHPYFSTKDSMGLMMMMLLFLLTIIYNPLMFADPENYNMANPMSTPNHIQPEWYFLFAYAILRSIPNKLGGVIALLFSIMVLLLPLLIFNSNFMTMKFMPMKKMLFWLFVNSFIILTWIGANPIEEPYFLIGQTFSMLYFLLFSMMLMI